MYAAHSHLYDSSVCIVKALEFTAHKSNSEYNLGLNDGDWDNKSRSDAMSLLHGISGFHFLVIYQKLAELLGISVQL